MTNLSTALYIMKNTTSDTITEEQHSFVSNILSVDSDTVNVISASNDDVWVERKGTPSRPYAIIGHDGVLMTKNGRRSLFKTMSKARQKVAYLNAA